MANCKYATRLGVEHRFVDGAWLITSKDLPGLFLAGDDMDRLQSEIPEAIKLLFKLNYDMAVQVCPMSPAPGATMGKPQIQKSTDEWTAIAA